MIMYNKSMKTAYLLLALSAEFDAASSSAHMTEDMRNTVILSAQEDGIRLPTHQVMDWSYDQRLEAFKETFPQVNTDSHCAPLADMPFGKTDTSASVIVDLEDTGIEAQRILNNATENNIILCNAWKNSGFKGYYDYESGLIAFDGNKREAHRTALEEFTHAAQNHPRLSWDVYRLPDWGIWKMATEAQAKLSVAAHAVREKHQGDDTLFQQHTAMHHGVSHLLDQAVEKDGLSALKDPEVLAEGFIEIMGNSSFVQAYFNHKIPGVPMDESIGQKEINIDDFKKHFGTIIGDSHKANFLNGVKDISDVVAMLPERYQERFSTQVEKAEAMPRINSAPAPHPK